MSAKLTNYCFHHPEMFVIPIEHLSEKGISDEFTDILLKKELFTLTAIKLFNKAFTLYWERAIALYNKAPKYWFPPRLQHICIVTKPEITRPYFQPFNKNSWLLYLADFDPKTSNIEFATYQFLHVERMSLLQQIIPPWYFNFSYFLTLSKLEIENFIEACNTTTRPDAESFQIVAKAMPSILQLYHEKLKKPTAGMPNMILAEDTGLIIGPTVKDELGDLHRKWSGIAIKTINSHKAAHAKPAANKGDSICEWLLENKPPLLVTDKDENILWNPNTPTVVEKLKTALITITESAENSILEDLKVIAFHSKRFLESLLTPNELIDPAEHMTASGLSYIHNTYKLIAYNIGSNENAYRLQEAAPPYERFMLGARTIHEWGHLVAESGWIRVSTEYEKQYSELEQQLIHIFEKIYAETTDLVRQDTTEQIQQLTKKSGGLGQALFKKLSIRIEDFLANLVAKRFLSVDEMDTYVRNNVYFHPLDYESETAYFQIVRHAYEYQYLRLSSINNPMQWFLRSTWFNERFIDTKVISKALFNELVTTIGQLCDCYQLDESKFDFTKIQL